MKKLSKNQIDRIADRLKGWKADLLTKEGRRILVQHVLSRLLTKLEEVFCGEEERMQKAAIA